MWRLATGTPMSFAISRSDSKSDIKDGFPLCPWCRTF